MDGEEEEQREEQQEKQAGNKERKAEKWEDRSRTFLLSLSLSLCDFISFICCLSTAFTSLPCFMPIVSWLVSSTLTVPSNTMAVAKQQREKEKKKAKIALPAETQTLHFDLIEYHLTACKEMSFV